MQITLEYLRATIENCVKQEQEFLSLANRARGAIVLAEALVAKLEEPEPVPATPPTLVEDPKQ